MSLCDTLGKVPAVMQASGDTTTVPCLSQLNEWFLSYFLWAQCIDLGMLADKLNMDPEAAEKWIVNLIRSARLSAKLDSQVHLLPCLLSQQPDCVCCW